LFRRTRAGAGPTDEEIDDDRDDRDDQDDQVVGADDGDSSVEAAPTAPAAAPARGSRDQNLKPSTMRGSEVMYGYIVALELIAVSVLNLTITHGPGAPTHPERLVGANLTSTELSVFGLVLSIGMLGVIQTKHRFIVPFYSIIAAFFVTLPKVPDSLSLTHLIALVVPVVYAFVLTQRQRKETLAQGRAGGGARAASTPAERRQQPSGRRRGRRQAPEPAGPKANRRYTPPKGKRPRR
jgi:hypothetical protein